LSGILAAAAEEKSEKVLLAQGMPNPLSPFSPVATSLSSMAYRYEHQDRVQFSDTDMAGIVHFSNFSRYMERAEHAFFRSLGLSVMEAGQTHIPSDERVGWPRVHASCDFMAPLYFEEEFTTEILVEEVRTKVLRYLFRMWKKDGALAAEGRITAACVQKDAATGRMRAVPIPQRILDKVSQAPAELLARPASQPS
jgi:acyl-CoA thioester hydrolase